MPPNFIKSKQTDIAHAVVCAELTRILPSEISQIQIYLCAAELIKQINSERINPNLAKKLVN